jgi:glucose/arabinose dehydrogenase
MISFCLVFGQPVLSVYAQGSIEWPQITLVPQFDGFDSPVYLANAGDGSQRLFIVEQQGVIRLRKNGVSLTTPFLDITDRVRKFDEKGLLSLAFPPDYATKQYFYIDYSDNSGHTVIARYRVTNNPDVADPASEEVILLIDQPTGLHNGGQLAFGPDGYLYISVGDGGPDGDPNNRAQDLSLLFGKILRIDVESANEAPYVIPSTNPYKDTAGVRPEIWARGLRNPWRFSFDRQTGDLYVGDVGDGAYEEIDFQPASSSGGENYGWRCTEGAHEFKSHLAECVGTTITLPVAEFSHELGCAVIGGRVYRGALYPHLQGFYFYADFCTGRVWGLKFDGSQWQKQILLEGAIPVVSFGEDENGELYLMSYDGKVYRLVDASEPHLAELAGAWQRVEQTCTMAGGEQRCRLHGIFPVQNQGPGRTGHSFRTRFYLSNDDALDDNDMLLKEQRAGSLKPGKIVRFVWGKVLPNNGSASGHYLFAVIDAEHTISEINEDNNIVRFGPIP